MKKFTFFTALWAINLMASGIGPNQPQWDPVAFGYHTRFVAEKIIETNDIEFVGYYDGYIHSFDECSISARIDTKKHPELHYMVYQTKSLGDLLDPNGMRVAFDHSNECKALAKKMMKKLRNQKKVKVEIHHATGEDEDSFAFVQIKNWSFKIF